MGTCALPYEVRSEKEYFDDIEDVKITRTCWNLPSNRRAEIGAFEPEQFRGLTNSALVDMIKKKRNGLKPSASGAEIRRQVIKLMDCIKRSLDMRHRPPAPARESGKANGRKPSKQRQEAAPRQPVASAKCMLPLSGSGKPPSRRRSRKARRRPKKPVVQPRATGKGPVIEKAGPNE